jgi:hypothetical protein
MMSAGVSGTFFRGNYIYNAELLRQTGEVFQGENYLYQVLGLDAVRVLHSGARHRLGVGLVGVQATGTGYSISNNQVRASSLSGPLYGVIFRNYFAWNKTWELQGRARYLLGEIKQLEFGADLIRQQGSFLLLGGVSYSSRDYEMSSGKQTSIRLSLGVGKEF